MANDYKGRDCFVKEMSMAMDNIKEKFPKVHDFLMSVNGLVDGKYQVDKGVFANVESYITQERSSRKFEAHKKYIDVQYMITGEEIIAVVPVTECRLLVEYDEKDDIAFYESCVKGTDYVLQAGECLVLTPEDAHMPCIRVDDSECVRKVVVKIPVEKECESEEY